MKKAGFLIAYIFIVFVVPFYPHIDQLYKPPILLSILLASFLYLSQPLAEKRKNDRSYHILTIGFIVCVLLPIIDYVYLLEGFHIRMWFGLAVAAVGLFSRIYSIQYLGKQFTSKVAIVDEHELIDSGPYKHIRHPSYTGSLIMLLGNALMYGSWIGICGVVFIMLPAYIYRTNVEEKTLLSHFGSKYADYMERSRKFL